MKTRLLKRLRRKAKNRVFPKWDGYEFIIVYKKWLSTEDGFILKQYECIDMQKGVFSDGFSVLGGTVFYGIDELKDGLVKARRCAILEMVDEYRNESIRKKIKNL